MYDEMIKQSDEEIKKTKKQTTVGEFGMIIGTR